MAANPRSSVSALNPHPEEAADRFIMEHSQLTQAALALGFN